MIKPNELRIGNALEYFVEDSLSESEWILNIVDADDIALACKDEYFNKYYRPVPLIPEILVKCGFKRHTYEMSGCKVWYLQDTSWRVAQSYRDENEYKLWHERVSPPTWNLKTLNYLHELQNLIFSLTGEELTFKP